MVQFYGRLLLGLFWIFFALTVMGGDVHFEGHLEKNLSRQFNGEKLTGECLTYPPQKLPRYCRWINQNQQLVLEEKFVDHLKNWQEQIIHRENNKNIYRKTSLLESGQKNTEELITLQSHQIIKTQIFKGKNQIETRYTRLLPQEQRQMLLCQEDQMKKWTQQMGLVQFVGSKDRSGYSTTAFGLRIHESCIQARKGAQKIINETSSALLMGLSCLKKMNTPQANDHRARIELLFRSNPKPKLTCNNKDFPWQSANAFATVNPAQDPEHPQISLNPKTCSHWQTDDFRSTFFHELFHNIGYLHGKDPEYAYTCAQCCFKEDSTNPLACQLCGETPKSIKDPKYLDKIIKIYNTNLAIFRPHELVIEQLTQNSQDLKSQEHRVALGANMVSYHLGQAYLDQMPPHLKKKVDPNLITKIAANSKDPALVALSPLAQKIVQAEFLMQKKDYASAEKVLAQVRYPKSPPKNLKEGLQPLLFKEALEETKLLHLDLLSFLANEAMNKQQSSQALKIYNQMDQLRAP